MRRSCRSQAVKATTQQHLLTTWPQPVPGQDCLALLVTKESVFPSVLWAQHPLCCLASRACVRRCNVGLNTGRLQASQEAHSPSIGSSWAFPLAMEVKVLEPACVEIVPNVLIPLQDWISPHPPLGQVYWTTEGPWPSEHPFPSSKPTPVCSVTAPVLNPRGSNKSSSLCQLFLDP